MTKHQIKVYPIILLFLLLLFIIIMPLLQACRPVEQTYGKTETTARTEIGKAIDNGMATSASVAIMDNGKLIYAEGFGMADRENNIPAD